MSRRREIEETYLTPKEILEKYPELFTKFNWSSAELGTILKCKILDGYYDRSKRNSLIREDSLKKLIEYINLNLEAQKVTV